MKRSSQVALLLMGVTGVGAAAGGYVMTRPQHCIPAGSPAASAPASPGAKALEPCPPRRDWVWFGGNDSSRSSSSWTRTNRSSGSLWPVFSRRSTSATPSGSVPLSGRSATAAGVPRASTSSSSTRRSGFGSTSSSYSRSSSS